MEVRRNMKMKVNKGKKGISLIVLVITIIVHCDKAIKYSNNNGFLLSSI